MIIVILGGIGSGKSLSAVKEIVDNKQFCLTNFKLKNVKDYHRIKVSDIIIKEDVEGKKDRYRVNWDYWENIKSKHKSYSIFLDEIHNIIHSRRSMSRVNIQMSKWVSQIRKILSDSSNNHLYIISQTSRKIDIDFRDLAQIVITCKKIEVGNKVFIKQTWYDGFDSYEIGKKTFKKAFLANRYFKFYDTEEMVTFSDAEEYI